MRISDGINNNLCKTYGEDRQRLACGLRAEVCFEKRVASSTATDVTSCKASKALAFGVTRGRSCHN
jgi:hypothetical protein